jgi:elongation factor P--beta-lysine ligase
VYLEKEEHFSPLKTMIHRQYSFKEIRQFHQGNNLIDVLTSNIDDFLSRNACVSSIY